MVDASGGKSSAIDIRHCKTAQRSISTAGHAQEGACTSMKSARLGTTCTVQAATVSVLGQPRDSAPPMAIGGS